jgi:hypothetical protein
MFFGNRPWNRPFLAELFCSTIRYFWSPATAVKPSFS